MNHLVIGLGEVGSAIAEVLQVPDSGRHDPQKGYHAKCVPYDFAHVCIPYTPAFNDAVRTYRTAFSIKALVIHSTVPVGTSRKHGALHSPVRGTHPDIASSMRWFVKYIGGTEGAHELQGVYAHAGIPSELVDKPETTEALKLWDTTQYGLMIALEKEIHRWCEQNGVDFETVYGRANQTYNEGYLILGRGEVVRPVLKHVDGPIGGHCVMPNLELLGDNPITRLIREASR